MEYLTTIFLILASALAGLACLGFAARQYRRLKRGE
jgi:hypothetical protein